jgi:hypothetical protein
MYSNQNAKQGEEKILLINNKPEYYEEAIQN